MIMKDCMKKICSDLAGGGGEEASENDEDEWLYQTYAHDVCRNQST